MIAGVASEVRIVDDTISPIIGTAKAFDPLPHALPCSEYVIVAGALPSPLTEAIGWLCDRISGVLEVHVDDSRYRGASIPNCSPARPAYMP